MLSSTSPNRRSVVTRKPNFNANLLSFYSMHRTTKVRSPRTNGFVERMNRTLLDECFRIKGRSTWYNEPEEIQRGLDIGRNVP